jgi:ribonuclease-3
LKPTNLERKLRLRFKDKALLDQALTHPSYLNELPPEEGPTSSYERLEFLGDAVLGAAMTLELYQRCPHLPEGQLTKLRSSLVEGKALASVARRLELGQHLKLGRGEESTGGRDRDSNLAASLEALVGAIFLDDGFDAARDFVLGTMQDEIESHLAAGVPEDPKSRLQELAQSMGGETPHYRLVEVDGPDHNKSFDVEVVMDGQVMGRGRGKRKLDAEKQAAEKALCRLETATRT